MVDLAGRTLVPGLVDAHTHIANFAAAKRALESGVTTVRSSGVSYFVDVSLRDLAKSGAIAAPRRSRARAMPCEVSIAELATALMKRCAATSTCAAGQPASRMAKRLPD